MDERRLETLVRMSLAGNTRAFGEIVAEHEKVLYNVALRMTHDREDARDIVQTAFLKAWRGLHTRDSSRSFFGWLYRIFLNETFDLLASRRSQVELGDDLLDFRSSPEEGLHEREIRDIVDAGLMRLSAEKRQIVVLRHFVKMSHREIGDVLGIAEKTVKSRLHEALRGLAAILEQQGALR